MKPEIRHRRLHAYFSSTVLNSLTIVTVVCLLVAVYMDLAVLPLVGAATSFILFVVYSLWVWICKPMIIRINPCMSDISGLFVVYFLAFAAFMPANIWWVIIPLVASIVAMFLVQVLSPSQDLEI